MVKSAELIPVNIEEEMKGSYLDYAMSVIIGRAIPDIRDGLKPAHRRILYAMFREGLLSNKRYSKCAGVVGEVLKKYHPHGDVAVYDTLVRMAQDWNMRYPLIDGQGNFGCFTGDTKVRLADGSSKSFEELVQDYRNGKTHFTYTIREGGTIAMASIQAPRLTKEKTEIVVVALDNGHKIRCTPNHRFMLRDGTYREARDLQLGDSLMPFYHQFYEGTDKNFRGYEEIYNPANNQWVFAHRLADEWNLEQDVYPRNAGRVRHHRDFNKLNNDPRNIVRMGWGEHRRLHQRYLKELWSDSNFEKKMRGVLSKLWQDPEFREKTIKAIGKENRRRWGLDTFKEKQALAKEKLWQDPVFRKRILEEGKKSNVLLFGTNKQRERIKKAQREWLEKMWSDPGYIGAQRQRMKEISSRLWADPKHREKIKEISRERMLTPEARSLASEWSKKLWADQGYYKARSLQSAKQWQSPAYRKKHTQHLKSNGEVTTRSRFLAICKRAFEQYGRISPLTYAEVRKQTPVKGVIHFEKGFMKYFNGDLRALTLSTREHHGYLNHQIVSVETAGFADVYDLTVDGTHNFALDAGVFVHNSIDGDSAAAYRYTEARLQKIAEEMLQEIDRETVDFIDNFDGTTQEPVVLPAKIPNLLLNGTDGIAVGMATKIPPHNLKELVNALIALIEKPETTVPELMKHIPGPDFPTGGFICGREGIKEAYNTGKGRVIMRARALIEPIAKGDREAIIITEIPFQLNKARLIERMAQLVQEGKMEGISDIRDESDREGMRVVVELKRGVVAGVVLNQLYKHTPMEETFGIILLAIVNQQPKIVNLKEALQYFVDHRREIVTRRTLYDLRKAEERAHILEGLKIALENIDDVIALIKKSKEVQQAKEALRLKYKLTDLQAQAILEMRLQRLTGLERVKILEEHQELQKLIKELKAILADEGKIFKIITDELKEIREKYGDNRRTEITGRAEDINEEDLIQEEEMVVTITHGGYIKRNPVSLYRSQRRGGRGKSGMGVREDDFVKDLFVASTKSYLLVFSTKGKVFWLKVHEIPQAGRTTKGKAISNLVQLASDESIAAIMPVKEFSEGYSVIMVTRQGQIKKTDLTAYGHPRANGIIALGLKKEDVMVDAKLTNGKQEIILSTRLGKAIRFAEKDVRNMGRTAAGVRGIKLGKNDHVVSMEVLSGDHAVLLTVTEKGYGKRTEGKEYRLQSRGGTGIFTCKITDKNGPVVEVKQVSEGEDIMLVTSIGKIIRTKVSEISLQGRATQGVRLMSMEPEEQVMSVAKLAEKEDEEE